MKTTFELITPERAHKMLKKNNINRLPSKMLILEYARQMRNGLWYEYTGESIKFAEDGTLLDGQQRLSALIEANISLYFKIDYGLDKIAFKYLDSGKKRTAGDKFYCAKIPNARNMAAGIKRYLILKSGRVIGFTKGGGLNRTTGSPANNFSDSEMLSIYEKDPDLWNNAYTMNQDWYKKSGRLLKCSEFLAFYMYFRDISIDDSFAFMSKLGAGINLTNNDPVKLLREKLTNVKINPTMNLTGYTKTALIYKTWNYFRRNELIKILRFAPDLDNFPVVI